MATSKVITINLPVHLLEAIDQACAVERRSRSSWIAARLERDIGFRQSRAKAIAEVAMEHGQSEAGVEEDVSREWMKMMRGMFGFVIEAAMVLSERGDPISINGLMAEMFGESDSKALPHDAGSLPRLSLLPCKSGRIARSSERIHLLSLDK